MIIFIQNIKKQQNTLTLMPDYQTDKASNYYECILQLRDVSKEVIQFAEKEIMKLKLGVAKIATLKNGKDYFTKSNDLTKKVGKAIQKHFSGELTITSTLHTKKKDKELYRLTILFRQHPFKKDDNVIYQGEEYIVKSVTKDIFLQNKTTGKKIHVKHKDRKQIKAIS